MTPTRDVNTRRPQAVAARPAAAGAGSPASALAALLLLMLLLLGCGLPVRAALLPAPESPSRPESPRYRDEGEPAWVGETLRPALPATAVDVDPLQLDPEARSAVPEWLDREPEEGERPSASVRSLYPDLPIHPAFPKQGLNFEAQPTERLALPPPVPVSGASAVDGGPPALSDLGKAWLLRHADASQVVRLREWRSWMAEHRSTLLLGLVAAALLGFGLSLWRSGGAAGRLHRGSSGRSSSRSRAHGERSAGRRERGSRGGAGRGRSGRTRSDFGEPDGSDGSDAFASTLPDSSFGRPKASRSALGDRPAGDRPSLPPDLSLRPKRHRGSGRSRSRLG